MTIKTGMRDVPLDELFTWRDEFGIRAKEAFGGHAADCSPQTYGELRRWCDQVESAADPFFEHALSPVPRYLLPVPLNGISVHMVREGEVPDGVLRGCRCGERAKEEAKKREKEEGVKCEESDD